MTHPIVELLSYLKIHIPKSFFHQLVFSHPEHPNMLSVADVLERLGIDYEAFRIDKKDLPNVEFPFLLLLDSGVDGVLIKDGEDLESNKDKLRNWSGAILRVNTTEGHGYEKNNEVKARLKKGQLIKLFLILLVSFAMVMLTIALSYSFSLANLIFAIASVFGFMIGYLLIAKELGRNYGVAESFCRIGKKSNCDKILTSEGSKFFGMISFSDMVVAYFGFEIILFCFSAALQNGFATFYPLFLVTSILAIPIVLFSVYYQYFRARVWCPLCLAVDATLVAQMAILAYVLYSQGMVLNREAIISAVMALPIFAIICLFIVWVKNNIQEKKSLNQDLMVSHRIKHSTDVFTYLLFQQRKIEDSAFNPEILIGNANAPIKIIMVSNLYCNPCKDQHAKIARLVDAYPSKVAVAFRFVQNGKDLNRHVSTTEYIIRYWLYNIHNKTDESINTEELLKNWYRTMNLEKFMKNYPFALAEANGSKDLEEQHYQWQKMVGISSTPTFFINGYELPYNYSVEDLMALAPGLAEYFSKVVASSAELQGVEKNQV